MAGKNSKSFFGENSSLVNDNDIMSTNKFYLSDKVKIAPNVKMDQDGNEISDEERDMEFIVTQTYSGNENVYFISKKGLKHKLSAKDLVKVND